MWLATVGLSDFIFISILLMLFISRAAMDLQLTCDPGEEFKSHNLTCIDDNELFNRVTWFYENKAVSNCDKNNFFCDSEYPFGTSHQALFQSNRVMILTIFNVSRLNTGVYRYYQNAVNNVDHNISCSFYSYAPPQQMSCQVSEYQENYVTVQCNVTRTYPNPLCDLSWKINGTLQSTIDMDSFENLTGHTDTEYYDTHCSLSLSVDILKFGSHQFEARAYPNVTGKKTDVIYGRITTVQPTVSINNPMIILDGCKENFYYENTSITCTCKEISNEFLKVKTVFYLNSRSVNESQGPTSYTFMVLRNMQGVFCQAKLLNITSTANFTSRVAYGPETLMLKVNNNSSNETTIHLCDKTQPVTVNINCSAPETSVNPAVVFDIYVDEKFQNNNNLSISSFDTSNGGQFNITCIGKNSIFTQKNTTKQVHVCVIEPPTEPLIYAVRQESIQTVISGVLTVPEGNITIGCKAEGGYPLVSNITVQCGSHKPQTSNGNVALFSVNISRYIDECSCTAFHQSSCYTKNTSVGNLNVTFPSMVWSLKINHKEENITIERNSSVHFSCDGEGNPSPIMLLTKKNFQLAKYSEPDKKLNLTLTFTKNLTDCRDTGVFVCKAGNSSKSITVFVNCAQELLDPTMNNTVYNVPINSSFNINISILGYPEPVYYLTGDEQLNSSNYNLSYIQLEPPYGILSLTILSVREEVFQNYTINITNQIGSLIYRFQINNSDDPEIIKGPNQEGYNIGAIVGGVAAGVVVVLAIILIIILLKRKGILGKKDKSVSNELLAADKVEVDNSDIYNLNSDSQQTDVDNADIYNMQSQLPVEVDNASIYNMKKTDSEKLRKNSEYKKYTDVTTTVTTASAAPKNMKTTVIPETTYEDVNGAAKLESKAIPKPPKPVPKPKPGQQLTKSDQNKAGNSVGTDQTYSTVVIEKKAAKPVTVKDKKEKELDFNTTEPEIPERKYEKKENNVNAKEQKALLNPTPDYDNVINTTNENPESTTIINSEFSNRQKDTDMYANVTDAPFHPTPDYHNVIESTNGNPESTIGTNSGISHAQMDTDVYANMTE